MGIYQDLIDEHGFTGGYQSVQRFVCKLRGAVSPEARVIIETRPGEESQVDYGTGPMVRDPDSGKYWRTRLTHFPRYTNNLAGTNDRAGQLKQLLRHSERVERALKLRTPSSL